MATLKNSNIDDTGFFKLPNGTTGERPSNPAVGYIRWNTDNGRFEFYNGTEWIVA